MSHAPFHTLACDSHQLDLELVQSEFINIHASLRVGDFELQILEGRGK